ncbi:MAG: hypothetical protein GY841_03215 [FCB group bacterium]|nr:hypothetical protein [FCB group bacterium]
MRFNIWVKLMLPAVLILGMWTNQYAQINRISDMTSMDQISTDVRLENVNGVFQPGEEVVLIVNFENTTSENLQLWQPNFAYKTISLEIYLNNEPTELTVSWSSPFTPESFVLVPGTPRDIRLELGQLFPIAMTSGSYRLAISVMPEEDIEAYVGIVEFEVMPMSSEIQVEYQECLRAISGGEHLDVIEMGNAFLANFPESIFASDLRLELGKALIGLERHEEAIAVYTRALESDKAADWQKTDAQWQIAWSHHAEGNLKEAIRVMKQVNTRNAEKYAGEWQAKADADK